MNEEQLAVHHFSTGKNCAQSVLMSFAKELKIDQEQAYKITSGFGGGIAHNGNICGAVSGAIMVLGMKNASMGEDAQDAKVKAFKKINEFITKFEKEKGSITCKELIGGIDLMTEEGRVESQRLNTHDKICSPLVAEATRIILTL